MLGQFFERKILYISIGRFCITMTEGVTNNYTVNNQAPNPFGVMRNRMSTPVKTTGTLERQPQNDKLELNNSKQGLSKGAKLGIGAVAVLGLGALAYVLTKGKIGSKQAQELAENIDFKPAKTIEEARAFAKDKLGIKLNIGNDLNIANFINEQLVQVSNFMKGKSVLPKEILIKSTKSAEGLNGYASWQNKGKKLNISSDMIDILKVLSEKSNGNIMNYLKQLVQDKTLPQELRECALQQLMVIPHELGHANHCAQCKEMSKDLMGTLGEMKALGVKDTHITEEFLDTIKNSQLLQKILRDQAKTAPQEFVADKFAWDVLGVKYTAEAEEILNRLYIKYGGPK